MIRFLRRSVTIFTLLLVVPFSYADSVNSPNITLNVDRNRAVGSGNGAGGQSLTVNTITIAETTLPEYSSGGAKSISIKVRPGFQFDSTSNITAQSATIGFNGGGINTVATVVPTGAANEVITFSLTSGTNTGVQDIIRISGVKIRILSAAGAVGPAQTTMSVTTSTAGGAFTDQGIVAANITTGAADHLVFGIQPANTQATVDILPAVKIVDFGGNTINNDAREITLSLQSNPGSTTLNGTKTRASSNGVASWVDSDNLSMTVAATGYTLRASHSGTAFLTSDTVDSTAFAITAGSPGHLRFTTQPVTTEAGGDLLITVTAEDDSNNVVTGTVVPVTLELAENSVGAILQTSTSLTKDTVNGVATWSAADDLRITVIGADYSLFASGAGAPITSNTFSITPGTSNSVRYVQQPADGLVNTALNTITAEVIDLFGNRTNFSGSLQLLLITNPCNATIANAETNAVGGLATFSGVTIDTSCSGYVVKGTAPGAGLAWAESDPFSITSEDDVAMALRSLQFTPKKSVSFNAQGSFVLPNKTTNNPTKKGATLFFEGTTGSVKFNLSKSGWKGLGKNGDGSKGFIYNATPCTATIKKNKISAQCFGKTGGLKVDDEGPVTATLTVKGTAKRKYCGSCGGTAKGSQTKTFKHITCGAPEFCK